ncbi:lyase family protein, partial [Staphylococcus epidermidis]|uniref:lyase family protein n=1 Tax=Staphylococcus epidermidis TaxID=1282 RepID=UPI0028CBB4AF
SLQHIHLNIHHHLIQPIPQPPPKLHTPPTPNHQLPTHIHFYTKQQLQYIIQLIPSFQQTILQLAHHHLHTIIPPYTHLQPPQPISFA